ncbi:hypothetical protein SMCF_8697, partial [Streptomyces coelicoflavus ZG0656]
PPGTTYDATDQPRPRAAHFPVRRPHDARVRQPRRAHRTRAASHPPHRRQRDRLPGTHHVPVRRSHGARVRVGVRYEGRVRFRCREGRAPGAADTGPAHVALTAPRPHAGRRSRRHRPDASHRRRRYVRPAGAASGVPRFRSRVRSRNRRGRPSHRPGSNPAVRTVAPALAPGRRSGPACRVHTPEPRHRRHRRLQRAHHPPPFGRTGRRRVARHPRRADRCPRRLRPPPHGHGTRCRGPAGPAGRGPDHPVPGSRGRRTGNARRTADANQRKRYRARSPACRHASPVGAP